ncbi:MAG: peptidoglycan DD-metalloendopeptidase family protein [Flavobacteriaceae bacterium]
MIDLLMYLLKASFVFTVLFMVYKALLSRLTFHTMNRFLLIGLIPVSLVLPFSNYLLPNSFNIAQEIPFIEQLTFNSLVEVSSSTVTNQEASINYWELASIIYFSIVCLYILRSILTIRKLWVLKKRSTIHHKEGIQIIETEMTEVFSFFRWIFVPKVTSEQINPIIVAHEKTHIKLKHSFDIILTELYTAFFWFNPLVYNFKKSLKSIHEFQVDHKLLQKEIQLLEYMQLLLQNLPGKKQEVLFNHFSQPILEKRVNMMTKNKSKQGKKLAYLIIVPISIFLSMAFGKENYKVVETLPQQETSFVFPVQNGSSKDITSHFGVKRKVLKKKQKRIHQGIDIRANEGTVILAASDGVVLKASMEGNWGNLIVIKHANGYETWYAHLQRFKISKNQQVKKGDVIGFIGNTGNSTGTHLHYELKHQGKNINPLYNIEE